MAFLVKGNNDALRGMSMDDKTAEKLLDEWKIRLGLQEWRITFCPFCKPEDMEGEGVGCTSWEEVIKVAKIMILDESYYGNYTISFDFEKTLVHELLHLKTCLISDTENELQERIAHQLIDDLARALVDAKRS